LPFWRMVSFLPRVRALPKFGDFLCPRMCLPQGDGQGPGNRALPWRERNERRPGRENNGVMFHEERASSPLGCRPRQLSGKGAAIRGRSSVRAPGESWDSPLRTGFLVRQAVVANGGSFCFHRRLFYCVQSCKLEARARRLFRNRNGTKAPLCREQRYGKRIGSRP
jgi:hypothetical protein